MYQADQATPDFILFAQHGWADTSQDISQLARSLASANTITHTPDLGWLDTWLTIAPLVDKVEKIAIEAIAKYPDLPVRIIGHSMGGLIWLEILARHREWWHNVDQSKIHSLVLIGSPIGGSDLGRLFDPFGWFPLIARDLGTNRRPIAEAIAAQIPTLSIVGDIGNHTDGTVPIGCSQFSHANFICLDRLRHPTLKNHPRVAAVVRQFWHNPAIAPISTDTASQLIAKLRSLDLTETNNENFQKAKVFQTYPDGTKLWTWTNSWQIMHIFVSDRHNFENKSSDRCVYCAYASWQDRHKLAIALKHSIHLITE
jgi:pimeloyl-ACP methyl ester carboxylesterase